jgi:hypothetical protein
MFGNDPDVMILRNLKNKLSPDERYTLCVLNNILGALVFSSDNVSLYGRDEHLLYAATFPKVISHVHSVLEYKHDSFMIMFDVRDAKGQLRRYTTYTNLTDDDQTIYLPESSPETNLLFATDNDMHMSHADPTESLFYHPSSAARLKLHETKTFLHIPESANAQDWLLLGSTSHIIPGVDMETFNIKNDEATIQFRKENTRNHKVYLAYGTYLFGSRPTDVPKCKINGKEAKYEWIGVNGVGEGRPNSSVLAYVLED